MVLYNRFSVNTTEYVYYVKYKIGGSGMDFRKIAKQQWYLIPHVIIGFTGGTLGHFLELPVWAVVSVVATSSIPLTLFLAGV
jgi:uncharacterized radical SAM superfamily protein